jgi:hypothetical protein
MGSQSESKPHSMSTAVKVEMAVGAAAISAIVVFIVGFFSSAIYSFVSTSYNADLNMSPVFKMALILMPAAIVLLVAIVGFFFWRDKKGS